MVLVILFDVEVDGSVALVGISIGENFPDELNLLNDVTGGVRFDARWEDIKRIHGLMVAVGVVLRHLHRLELLQTRLLGDFVLALVGIVLQMAHIGDVSDITHLIT